MREITIYCSARDQEVSVVVDHDPLYDGEASVLDSTLYCLEIGHTCTGTTCPLGAEPAPSVGTPPYTSSSRPTTTGLAGPGELR